MRRRHVPQYTPAGPRQGHGLVDWRQMADKHRPTDPQVLAAEIRRLYGTNLKARDIAIALRLDLAVVLDALKDQP